MVDPQPALAAPRFIDTYQILGPLGAGSMATVYRARDTALDRTVALKVVTAPHAPSATARFALEACALGRLRDRHVPAAYHAGVADGIPYLALELVRGPRVDQLELPLPWVRTAQLALGLARALLATHGAGIVHRDVKPSNIMLTDAGEVKLIDFGLALLTGEPTGDGDDDDDVPRSPSPTRLTATGDAVGTPLFMAPELWTGETATPGTDLYAFGLVIYELLAGALPHAGLDQAALILATCRHPLPPLAGRCPRGVPRAFTDLIDQCVDRDPRERPGSAAALLTALEACIGVERPRRTTRAFAVATGLDAVPTEPAVSLPPRPRRELRLVEDQAAAGRCR